MRLIVGLVLAFLATSCGGSVSLLTATDLEKASQCSSEDHLQCLIPKRDANTTTFDSTTQADGLVGYCCKVCSTGKACGDSCISRNKECHKQPGCACNR